MAALWVFPSRNCFMLVGATAMSRRFQSYYSSMSPVHYILPQTRQFLSYIFVAINMGLASVNLMHLVPKAAILCEIVYNGGHWPR